MCLFCFSSEPLSPDEAKGGQSVLAVVLLVTVPRLHINTPILDMECRHHTIYCVATMMRSTTWFNFRASNIPFSPAYRSFYLISDHTIPRQVWGSVWPIRWQLQQVCHHDVPGAIQSLSLLDLQYDLLSMRADSPAEEGSESH